MMQRQAIDRAATVGTFFFQNFHIISLVSLHNAEDRDLGRIRFIFFF